MERETATIQTYRIAGLRSMEHHPVAQVANHTVGYFNRIFLSRVVTAERTLIVTVFVNLYRAIVKIDGVIDMRIMRNVLARGKTEHLVGGGVARIGAHTAIVFDGLLRNGTRVPILVAAIGNNRVAAYAKRSINVRKGHLFFSQRVASLQHILFDDDTQGLARFDINKRIIGIQVRGYGADMLGFQTGRYPALPICAVAVAGNKGRIRKCQRVGCTHFHTVNQPNQTVVAALVGKSGGKDCCSPFTNSISVSIYTRIQAYDFNLWLVERIIVEPKRVTLLGRILDTGVFGHIDAVNLIAGSESRYQRVSGMYMGKTAAVGILHIPFEYTGIVGGSMRLEDNHFFVRTNLKTLVAVDGDNRFRHLGVFNEELVALYCTFRNTTTGRFHFHIKRGMVNHIRIMVGEEAVVAYVFAIENPFVFGFIASPLAFVTEEMFTLVAFDNMNGIVVADTFVVDAYCRRFVLFHKYPDGIGKRAIARCRRVDGVDIVSKRIQGDDCRRYRIACRIVRQGPGRIGITHGNFAPAISNPSGAGRYSLERQLRAGTNRGIGRKGSEQGFGRKGNAINTRTSVPVCTIYIVGGYHGRTHLGYRIKVNERITLHRHHRRIIRSEICPSVILGAVGPKLYDITTAESKVGSRFHHLDQRNIYQRLDGVRHSQTFRYAANAGSQCALNTVARQQGADIKRLAVF